MTTMTVERDEGLVTVTFNRPETKNALSGESWVELEAVLDEVSRRAEDRALLLTGTGGNFSSGADLSGSKSDQTGIGGEELRPIVEEMRRMGDILLRLARLPKPTLAKVDGVAVGVGLGVALACDLVVASDRARFSAIFAKRGLALDGGTSWILPRLVGLQKAKELAFFGDMIPAADAAQMGLVNRVVPVDELDELAATWARRLAGGPTLALGLSKRLLNASSSVTFEQALEDEGRCQHITYTSKDMWEALKAYGQKREPTFRGR